MSLRLVLTESDSQIEKKINQAIADEMNIRVGKNARKIENKIKALIPVWIEVQPEVDSLRRDGVPNSLASQLGLLPGQGDLAVSQIVAAVNSSLEVKVEQIKPRTLKGGVTFSIQPESFRNLLGLSAGQVITEQGETLDWLDWLLVQGTATIVYGYSYTPDFSGRSGGGTMKSGGIWRIPPEYAGTLTDNFVTRALSSHDRELKSLLQEILND
jgi:hypothetical protein